MSSDLQVLFSYLSFYPDLMRATSDDASPTPGYLLHNIAELTLTAPAQSAKLVEFLVTRLQTASSPTVKLKTLRVMLYCARHGHAEFRQLLRSRDGDVTAASAASGPPDPVLGMTPHLWVRSTAQELLSLLFSASDDVTERAPRSPMVGLGPVLSPGGGGQYQGFGVSTAKRSGGASLPSRLRGLMEEALSPPSPGPPAPDVFATSAGQYESPPRLSTTVDGPELPVPLRRAGAAPPRQARQPPARGHIPGRAGGGWEESDDEPADVDDVSVGSDVAAAIDDADEAPARSPVSPEVVAIGQFCSDHHGHHISLVDAVQLADRLTAAGGGDVTAALVDQLTRPSDVTRLRALVLLDCLLQAGPTGADSGAALAEAVGNLVTAEDERVKTKALKIGRIMERLAV
ncbi:AP-4 complex accessory subunit Tepsin-like isoform X2 [Amphibalanus amphitrite]|uniref:AP-4 complex accessory subunit Tepsin-like isoform X2 n=1 Tax=Amphibalanus amphitrite TaxID=1232801 RepID=UPI001C925007|nr:AP-4 complex accessory subunit Tepsin-like isoform X2 [Amphibalanus amphitrite]